MEIEMKFSSSDSNTVCTYIKDETGIVKKKVLSMTTVLELLNSCAENVATFGPRTGRMPEGFVDSVFDFQTLTGRVAIHIPKHLQPLNYNGEIAMIPFPNLLMFHTFKGGVLQKSLAFSCIEDTASQIDNDTVLYNYPFGNVSPGPGKVCWGINRHEKLNSISDINLYTDKFLNSETNSDLYQKGVSNLSGLGIEAFLQMLKGKNDFNNKLLKISSFTFGKVLEK